MFCYAHYSVGKKILELSQLKLNDDEKEAYYAGLVYADIGRFKLDKKTGVESDSKKFLESLKKNVKSKTERWFLFGISVHIFTDKKTKRLLKSIFKVPNYGYISYIRRCSILEYYFFKKTNFYIFFEKLDYFSVNSILSNLNFLDTNSLFKETKEFLETKLKKAINNFYKDTNKINLKLPLKLLIDTYKDLGTIVSKEGLEIQAANLIGACALVCSFATGCNKNLEEIFVNIENRIKILCEQGKSFLKRKAYFNFVF